MAIHSTVSPNQTQYPTSPEVVQAAEKGVKSLQAFITKFNNDWVMNFASGLAFNLITAIFPILIAIISIAGFTIGRLDPGAETQLINGIKHVFPEPIQSGNVLGPALNSLSKNAGFLGIIAIFVAIFGGSRLFVTMEGYFDIIYHTRPRGIIKQNIMAIMMLLVFVVLVPLMVFASSIPALLQSLLKTTPLGQFASNVFIDGLISIIAALIISWILFEAIYIVVPNQHISFRRSWPGALVAAVAIQIYLILFPFYVTHFLNSYTGTAGFAVILLFFFYYFAVILLLGAEINAFFAEGIRATPDNLAVMVHQMTSHLPTSKKAMQEQASITHKHEEPKEILPKSETSSLTSQENMNAAPPGQDQSTLNHRDHQSKKAESPSQNRGLTIIEIAAGTALAFFVQFFRLRRKK